jgi:hypothetical protein
VKPIVKNHQSLKQEKPIAPRGKRMRPQDPGRPPCLVNTMITESVTREMKNDR